MDSPLDYANCLSVSHIRLELFFKLCVHISLELIRPIELPVNDSVKVFSIQ